MSNFRVMRQSQFKFVFTDLRVAVADILIANVSSVNLQKSFKVVKLAQ